MTGIENREIESERQKPRKRSADLQDHCVCLYIFKWLMANLFKPRM